MEFSVSQSGRDILSHHFGDVALAYGKYNIGDERYLSASDLLNHDSFGSHNRRNEFAAGRKFARLAASHLLGRSCQIVSDGTIPRVLDGGAEVSISHKDGSVVALAAFKNVGIDLEFYAGVEVGPIVARIVARVCSDSEVSLVKSSSLDRNKSLLTLFSAKEAAFKAFSSAGRHLSVVSKINLIKADWHSSYVLLSASFAAEEAKVVALFSEQWIFCTAMLELDYSIS